MVTSFRIKAIAVGAMAFCQHIAYHDIAAMYRMMLPERRVVDLVALHQHIRTTDELYHRWAQIMSQAEDALTQRNTSLRKRWQVIRIGSPLIIVTLYAQPVLFIDLRCDFFLFFLYC